MGTYIKNLQANGNTLDEAIVDFKKKLEDVLVPMYPKELATKNINGLTYLYADGVWSLLLDEVVIIAKTKNSRAFVVAPLGIRLHATPISKDAMYLSKKGIAKNRYDPGTQVMYLHSSPNAPGWAYIETSDGTKGHIERSHLLLLPENPILDNFTEAYHYVSKEGEGLESIINTYFSNFDFKRGKDKRTIAEALILLNQSSGHNHGLSFKKGEEGKLEQLQKGVIDAHDPWFAKAREQYATVQVSLHKLLRIPTEAYIDYLAEMGQLSQRPELLNQMINVGEIIVDATAGVAGVIVGVVEGFVMGIWDALEGLVDLVSGVIDVIKKLVQGTFLEDLNKMFAMMANMTWEDIKKLGDAITGGLFSAVKNFASLSAFDKGRVIGKIIGAVLLELVLAFFTAGAANAAKWAGKLGKFAKVAKTVAKAGDDLLGPLRKMNQKLLNDIGNKIPKKFRSKNGKGDYDDNEKNGVLKQITLNLSRAEAFALDASGATIQQLALSLRALATPLKGSKFYFDPEISLPGPYNIDFKASPKKDVIDGFTSGKQDKVPKIKKHSEVEIVDNTGKPIGEFDEINIDLKTFIEDKSAKGINTINSRTGKLYTTPMKWAEKQLYEKTVVRIKNLKKATSTRATKGNSAPSLEEIKDFKKLVFRIEETGNKALEQASKSQIKKLKTEFPDWKFEVKFGN